MLTCETVDKDLKAVGLELMFLTPEKCSHEDGVTAVELAKMVGLPVDVVKKNLNASAPYVSITSIGSTPLPRDLLIFLPSLSLISP